MPGSSKNRAVYESLRRSIRELELPPATPIDRERVAEELGVSRAPVGEALARLREEGLVEIRPQHGTFVAPIRPDAIREAWMAREVIEPRIAAECAERVDDRLRQRLAENLELQEAALAKGNLSGFYDLDERLHAMLFEAASAKRMLRFVDAIRAPLDRLRRLALPENDRAVETLSEHRRIIEAIHAGDADLAAAAMRSHIRQVKRALDPAVLQLAAANGEAS
ncbi:MAG: GntR family transcriptional regulator [Erythrobacter sp.]|uniref:GntR family transcriptional regulator n=1 Tax=Erythrobacter sp. TaxID=1042 RepID=UPI002613CAAC|nr:GntR family transcriptional regulator [Erythrobacter sp.]MDJ0978134.1 GntR family transcriptional regulator [Erythrobacter sp.]